jgi:hypothetical protein
MKISLMILGFSLLMGSISATSLLPAAQSSKKEAKKSVDDVLKRVAVAHGKEQLAMADMLAEGTVMVYPDKDGKDDMQPTVLKVTLLRNGEHQSQRIMIQLAGKAWDGHGESLTPEGKRALDFLETQYARGPRQLLKTSADTVGVTVSDFTVTLQENVEEKDGEKEGETTAYFLDSLTSRLAHFEFERGQYRDTRGRFRPNVHSYGYSDYRSTDGIATPYRVEHDTNGIKQEELQLTAVHYIAATRARKQ